MTTTDRIVSLVEYAWQSTAFEAKAVATPFNSFRVLISKKGDPMKGVLASLDIEAKVFTPGFTVRASVAGFNGTLEQIADSLAVASLLAPFLAKLESGNVIRGI